MRTLFMKMVEILTKYMINYMDWPVQTQLYELACPPQGSEKRTL